MNEFISDEAAKRIGEQLTHELGLDLEGELASTNIGTRSTIELGRMVKSVVMEHDDG